MRYSSAQQKERIQNGKKWELFNVVIVEMSGAKRSWKVLYLKE